MSKNDNLYDNFCDPSVKFQNEPRGFCYDLARKFIEDERQSDGEKWRTTDGTIKGILLLLLTWNFAAKETKKPNFQNIREVLIKTNPKLRQLEEVTIETVDGNNLNIIKDIFAEFRKLMGQTGASKALSLLNPRLFVMWDTEIRRRLRKSLIPGIKNGELPEHYIIFLEGIKNIIAKYKINEKILPGSFVAKKIDEFHYVHITMNKNAQ
jgi:hypothetical protein